MLHVKHAQVPHVNPDFFTFHTVSNKKIIKIPVENPCMWVATLSTVKSITNTFISWPEKTKKENKKQPVGSLFLLNSCCEQAAAGCSGHFLFILCHCNPLAHSVTCTIHVQLQRTAWNVGFHTFLATFYTIFYTNTTWNLSMEKRLIRMLHINRVREPHVNLHYFTFHPVSQRKLSKFHLKIPACESQHILQWNLSQIHSYHGIKRPKKKTKSNLWEVCFSSTAVVSKLLLGCSGHFLFILCHCNRLAHSVMCTIHVQLQRTAWNVGFHTYLATFHTISYTNTILCQWNRD